MQLLLYIVVSHIEQVLFAVNYCNFATVRVIQILLSLDKRVMPLMLYFLMKFLSILSKSILSVQTFKPPEFGFLSSIDSDRLILVFFLPGEFLSSSFIFFSSFISYKLLPVKDVRINRYDSKIVICLSVLLLFTYIFY